MGTQWPGMGRGMMAIDTFRRSIMESSEVLQQYGISVYKMIIEGADNQFDSALNSFICITAIQVSIKIEKNMQYPYLKSIKANKLST